MGDGDARLGSSEDGLERLARLTARLASTSRLEDVVDAVLEEIVDLGFTAAWIALLDDGSRKLRVLTEIIDGVVTAPETRKKLTLDMLQPSGQGFRRQLLGSRGQVVGAIGLASYRGEEAIPDEVVASGLLRSLMDHLGIAMERTLHITRLERLDTELAKARETIANDARITAVGKLAAAVAHDLNNLAGVALMAISVGLRSPTDAHEALPRIEKANRAIGDLVRRLQRVARVDGPDSDGSAAVANLRQVVDDVLALVTPILREQSVVIDALLPEAPAVRADPVLCHQIALNLILNARDSLAEVPPERRRLRVDVREDNEFVHLVIADRGVGIAPGVASRLFEPFVTTKPGHTGLGLAAARAALKQFGGRIDARNLDEGGAEFRVMFARAHEGVMAVAARHAVAAEASRRGGAILVVDDDEDLLIVTRAFLEPLGYEILTASDGEQALAAVKSRPLELVLCDVGMPKCNGQDIWRQLRGSGFQGKLVLMTGWDDSRIRFDRRAAGCDAIIMKPFLGHDLLQVVDAQLHSPA